LWSAGGYIVAQDEASSVVFGMPKVAIDRGVVHQIANPDEIAQLLLRLHEHRKTEFSPA
jgi:two-component system chemotaxis response regulator CheB